MLPLFSLSAGLAQLEYIYMYHAVFQLLFKMKALPGPSAAFVSTFPTKKCFEEGYSFS